MAKSYFKEVEVVIKERVVSKFDKLFSITKRISNGKISHLFSVTHIRNLIANAIKLKEKLHVKLSLSMYDEDLNELVTIGYADNELECDFTSSTKITDKKLTDLENQLTDWIINKMEAGKWKLFDKYQDIEVDLSDSRFSITCWFNVSSALFSECCSPQKAVKPSKPTSSERDSSESNSFEITDDMIPF